MRSPRRNIQDFERFEEIVHILFEEGFGFALDKMNLIHHVPLLKRLRNPRNRKPGPERVRETFEKLGPTFIKFGQIMAQRPDLVPESYREELEKLEDSVPPFNQEKAKEIVEGEIGLEKFSQFEDEPLASASIAQVHKAELQSGEKVVVKVRRPGIKQQMEKDLDIIEFFASRGEKHMSKLREIHAEELVEEFSEWTKKELDLKREARNAEIFQENLADEGNVKVPDVYTDLTTERVLVMEYVDGIRCTEEEKLKQLDIQVEKIAKSAIRAGLKQTLRDGFYHADPHPSNFLIQEDGTLVYLDFGMMGKLSKDMRDKIGLLFLHAAKENVEPALKVVTDIAHVEPDADLEGLKQDIEEKIMLIRNSKLGEHSISRELVDITIQASKRGVHMPASFALIGKSLVTMEGIGLTIYPEFEVTEEYEEIAEKILMEKYNPEEILEEELIDLVQNKELLERPFTTLRGEEEKRQEIQIEQEGSQKSTIIAGLLIGSAIIISQNLSSQEASMIAMLGVIVALILFRIS